MGVSIKKRADRVVEILREQRANSRTGRNKNRKDDMTTNNRTYGWKPSPPDQRDFLADTTEIKVLPEVDPRGDMMDPYDQLQLGACTANAVAAAIEYQYSILKGHHQGTPSRLFIYYGERELEGSLGQGDTGAYGRDGFKYAHKVGAPPERDWPYDISKFEDAPAKKLLDEASHHRIGDYRSVPRSISQFKKVLSNKQTVAFGFTVYESFESDDVASSGLVPYPDPDEQILGGHEVLIIGYLKSEPHYALCRNSWGTGWALGGYFLMPWTIILDTKMSDDFRTIRRPL